MLTTLIRLPLIAFQVLLGVAILCSLLTSALCWACVHRAVSYSYPHWHPQSYPGALDGYPETLNDPQRTTAAVYAVLALVMMSNIGLLGRQLALSIKRKAGPAVKAGVRRTTLALSAVVLLMFIFMIVCPAVAANGEFDVSGTFGAALAFSIFAFLATAVLLAGLVLNVFAPQPSGITQQDGLEQQQQQQQQQQYGGITMADNGGGAAAYSPMMAFVNTQQQHTAAPVTVANTYNGHLNVAQQSAPQVVSYTTSQPTASVATPQYGAWTTSA